MQLQTAIPGTEPEPEEAEGSDLRQELGVTPSSHGEMTTAIHGVPAAAVTPPLPQTALAPRVAIQPVQLFGTSDPLAIVAQATRAANALADVINKRKLFAVIQGRKYVLVEGWTLLGSMLGVFTQTEWTRQIEGGWEARVLAIVAATGTVIGAAEQMCVRKEKAKGGWEDYALRGMAQTRATSRALREPLGFVVKLAGFEATAAEEMPNV